MYVAVHIVMRIAHLPSASAQRVCSGSSRQRSIRPTIQSAIRQLEVHDVR